jgi:hypothetical protein
LYKYDIAKKEPQIETILIMEYPLEIVDALGFTPIGQDEPHGVLMKGSDSELGCEVSVSV